MNILERANGPRWAYFMGEARISLDLAKTSPTSTLKRLWLEQAASELDRAALAAEDYQRRIADERAS